MEEQNKYYEITVTDPFRQLIMGKEYLVDGTDMIYHGSRGTNMYGEGENGEYNFRTPVTVIPTSNMWIRNDDFNNHDIIQKAVPLTKIMLKDLRQNPRNTLRLEAVEKASNNIDDIFYEIGKFGGKKRKNKSRKVKKSRRTKRRWSLKYKRSINCKKPKGFSQKQYCKRKGKKHLTRRKK